MTERYLTPESDPPSDPEGAPPPKLDDDTTKSIVTRLEKQSQKAQGAATVSRIVGGALFTIALAVLLPLIAAGVSYASQAAVDHDRVGRLEEDVRDLRTSLDAIRSALARIEGRLERREE